LNRTGAVAGAAAIHALLDNNPTPGTEAEAATSPARWRHWWKSSARAASGDAEG